MGGQISSQGTSALDETSKQRSLLYYPRGYKELRRRIEEQYGRLNPGECWVSVSCYLPSDCPCDPVGTVAGCSRSRRWNAEMVSLNSDQSVGNERRWQNDCQRDRHSTFPQPGTPPLNSEPLSQTIEDAYRYADSPRFKKEIIRFVPAPQASQGGADWYVVEATETGELIALADVPYRLGLGPANPPRTFLPRDRKRSLLHPRVHLYLCDGGNSGSAIANQTQFLQSVRPLTTATKSLISPTSTSSSPIAAFGVPKRANPTALATLNGRQ